MEETLADHQRMETGEQKYDEEAGQETKEPWMRDEESWNTRVELKCYTVPYKNWGESQ